MAKKIFGIRRRDYSERHSHRKPETGRDVLSTEGAQGLQSGGRRAEAQESFLHASER